MGHTHNAQFWEFIVFLLVVIIICLIRDGKEEKPESENEEGKHEFIGPCPKCDPEKDRCCY